MIEVSSTSSFCSNPDALGIDESEKGIYDALKNIAREVLQQEVEKPVVGLAAFAREILSCHSSLVVSDFLFSNFCCVIEYFVLIVLLLVGSGQTSRGTGRVPSAGWRGSPVDG